MGEPGEDASGVEKLGGQVSGNLTGLILLNQVLMGRKSNWSFLGPLLSEAVREGPASRDSDSGGGVEGTQMTPYLKQSCRTAFHPPLPFR